MKKVLKFLCLLIIVALIAILVLKNGARADAIVSAGLSEQSISVGGTSTVSINFSGDVSSFSGTISYNGEGGISFSSGSSGLSVSGNSLYYDGGGSQSSSFSVIATGTSAGSGTIDISIDGAHFVETDTTDSGSTSAGRITIEGEEPSQDPSISIGIDHSTLMVGGTAHVYVTSIYPEDDSVTYSIEDNPEVASISEDGTVLALNGGSATITARTGSGASATQMITVRGDTPQDPFTANPSSITTIGTTNVSVSGGAVGNVLSSNESVATAIPYGDNTVLVNATGNGDATITITKRDSSETATVQVHIQGDEPQPPEGETPVLNPTSVTLNAGGESATISSSIPVTWSSSDTSKVAIASNSSDTQAVIISNNSGTATIIATAKEGGKTATASVTVNKNEQAAPTIFPSGNIKMEVGKSVFLSANQAVTWSSSNTSVATVTSDGTVVAKGVGEAKITAKNASGKTSSVTITVVSSSGGETPDGTDPDSYEPANPDQGTETTSTFAISPTKTQTLNIGDTLQIKVTKGTAASWKSSKPAVATVDNNGKVTANSAGTTIITAVASDGSVAQVKVRVRDENGEVPDPDSESNTDVPSTGEASTSLLLVLGTLTCIIAMFIFRKKTK